MTDNIKPVHIIGAGLAGSEAAWQCVSRGVPVVLHEMRPSRMTDAHETDGFAELVCSNSLTVWFAHYGHGRYDQAACGRRISR